MAAGWRRWLVAALLATWPAGAWAQTPGEYEGQVTALAGAASGGDVPRAGLTGGVAVAVFDPGGWGAELDIGHTRGFDPAYVDSGLTTLTINAVRSGVFGRVRPFVGAGGGLLRVRACAGDCVRVVSRTDWALDASGGASVLVSEHIGVRGEVRYVRFLGSHPGLPAASGAFDYWRTSLGVTLSWPFGW
ncbi:MAG: outer membrane beta-barrel protein [Vicinamibacterales bacterium]